MRAFTGTWLLVKLALRRDRLKIPLILVVMTFLFFASAQAVMNLYGDSKLDQIRYASTAAPSAVARVFGGPLDGPDIGAIVLNETYLSTVIAVAFASTMMIVRHTRQNEEFGRSELIESGVVSRHASLLAATIITILFNLAFGILVYLSLLAVHLPSAGAAGTGATIAATGITFAAIAAIASQLADNARSANSFSALAIGVAFIFRALGDSMGDVTKDGLAVQSAFPTWLSPIGWGQLMHPFTDQNWWILGLFAGLFALAFGISLVFMAKRDIGMGMIATRLGRATARKSLLSPWGLARRLQFGALRGWAIALTILGITFGFIIKDFEEFMAESEEFQAAFQQIGLNADIGNIFLSVILSMVSILIAGYAIQSLLRMRAEEANGQAEFILSGSVSRYRWQLSHIGFVVFGVAVLTMLNSLALGVSYIVSTGSSWSELAPIVEAAFSLSVAVLVLASLCVAIIALAPRMAVAVSWACFAGCLLILQLGHFLGLPQWVINLSPFSHLPAMPAENFEIAPIVWLLIFAVNLLIGALLYFNRRDIITA